MEPGDPPKAVLYRWWTDTCPYCESSLPAIERLRKKYGEKGLAVVAAYHPKPPRSVDDETILETAERFGYYGPVAVDIDWSELKKAYLDSGRRRATSVSLLVDSEGVIRFVHPGPVLFPSKDQAHIRENEDFEFLENAVRFLLEVSES